MIIDEYDDAPLMAYCIACGQECRPRKVDYGVGRIEVHGHVFNHHDWQYESPCCNAPVDDSPPAGEDDDECLD